MRPFPALPALAMLVISCGSGDSAPKASLDPEATAILATDTPETLNYHADLQVDLTQMTQTTTGLYFQDLLPGSGDSVVAGRTAVVHYTGWLPDGTQFDSSVGGSPFSFRVGGGNVIQGWDQGLIGMRAGGKRKLVIPSHLGYGPEGIGPIPSNATLVFDVELLEIR